MRRGISVTEVLIVVVLIGLMTLIAAPRLDRALASIVVDAEARRIAAAHTRARMMAVTRSRVLLLRIAPDSLWIAHVSGADTTRLWTGPGPAAAGVALTGPEYPLRFTPLGVTFGVSNGTWTVSYRGVSRKVVVSRLGRVRIR
jgi:type II secretory pathway pseudopilin PulG